MSRSALPTGQTEQTSASAPRADIGADMLKTLVACPQCDTLHSAVAVDLDTRARCKRCHAVLLAPRRDAFTKITVLAITSSIMMVAAVFFPFLTLEAGGFRNATSVFDAVLAFSSGLMIPLSVAVAGLIILIPFTRLLAIIYTLWPLLKGRPPYAHARAMFRLAEGLRPWSMAEIFIVGVTVALVKVAGLASVSLGPAFWAFVGLVLVTALQDSFMCRLTVWKALDQGPSR